MQPVNDELTVKLIFAWQRKDLDSEAVRPLPDLHGKYLGQIGGVQPGDACVVIEYDFWRRKERLGKGKQRGERQRPEPSSEVAAVSSIHKTGLFRWYLGWRHQTTSLGGFFCYKVNIN